MFVGGLEGYSGAVNLPNWRQHRAAALYLPNVRHIGKVPQEQVKKCYWSFAINWIPYAINHPFNQASCPTKIMDSIATGRPVLSTAIPECRLYPERIKIFRSAEEAAELGPLLQRLTRLVQDLLNPDQVYVSLWSHMDWVPVHIHFVIQPIAPSFKEIYGLGGPALQAEMMRRGELTAQSAVEDFCDRARELLRQVWVTSEKSH